MIWINILKNSCFWSKIKEKQTPHSFFVCFFFHYYINVLGDPVSQSIRPAARSLPEGFYRDLLLTDIYRRGEDSFQFFFITLSWT